MKYSWLPGVLAEIAEVAGLDAALAVADKRGGTEVYIPARVTQDHWLIETCGHEAAAAICEHFSSGHGGVEVEIPLGPRGSLAKIRARVDEMIRQKRPESEIALAAGYTTRGVRKRKVKMRSRDREPRLF